MTTSIHSASAFQIGVKTQNCLLHLGCKVTLIKTYSNISFDFSTYLVQYDSHTCIFGSSTSKESIQGTCDFDSTCLYSAIAKPNMTIKAKNLSISVLHVP